ncbi:unnamed protein product [Gongylonema pulchrum]|uniref:ANF_receptor domain-containing protein n=1 Tax=Gongylonema pulchrum TaxID=637853 RepID=A0A183DED7_9BILA|nr:unnamed protein product [Gongylonema pulchrum]
MARAQDKDAEMVCVTVSQVYYGLSVIYGRKQLVDAYFNLGYTAFSSNNRRSSAISEANNMPCLPDFTFSRCRSDILSAGLILR